jgi:hypothetical protein
MSTNNSPPGLVNPTQIGMIGSNPQQSAYQTLVNMNQKQTSLCNAVGGRKQRKGGAVAVPQFQMQYPVQNGPGQDPNSQVMSNSSTSMQRNVNASNDYQATNMNGGSVKWGCYSGGIRRKTRKTKTRKTKTRRAKKRNTKRNRK